jgi:hypothetical protein
MIRFLILKNDFNAEMFPHDFPHHSYIYTYSMKKQQLATMGFSEVPLVKTLALFPYSGHSFPH